MMTITLTADLERAITDEARRAGISPQQLALDGLRRQFLPDGDRTTPPAAVNLAEYLGDSIGSIDSAEIVPGGANLSMSTGRRFAAGMVKKRQEGNL